MPFIKSGKRRQRKNALTAISRKLWRNMAQKEAAKKKPHNM
jgi:hypothetical protein